MDIGTVLSVAQTLFSALQTSELRDICSVLGYKSELDSFENTVNTVKAVLLDAEAKADHEELSYQAQLFIEELKDAVYDADDLLDEFVTLAQRKHKKFSEEGAGKFYDKVHRFLSRLKEFRVAYQMSHGVKGIRKKLDAIADNHSKFGFKLDSQPIRNRREETCSYVYAQDIIGRDTDREKIVGILLDPKDRNDVSFLTIVGMAGMGKTSLAQLIYNDERIIIEFPTRRWVCVADEDPNHMNVTAVLAKIAESITGDKYDKATLEWLQCKVREQLVGKKYLLVLDDVWNENHHDWLGLESFLKGGPSGSWVVVTTRSSKTARMVGDGSSYELQGLSNEDSWNLFERIAFGKREGHANPIEFVEIGKKIVKKCANVPLALRVVGSLLYGQGQDKWLSFKKNELVEVSPKKNNLFPILKFSYHHLDSPLKSCFCYCALFPKDHRIHKEMLISLWMAQGFIVPLEKGQSIEEAGEEYLLILVRRCFFQDVEKNEYGEIVSFKLHDLMHNVAQEVSKKEVYTVDYITSDFDKKVRHLSVVKDMGTVGSIAKSTTRTLLFLCRRPMEGLSVGALLDKGVSLRALDLSDSEIIDLPNQIGNLLHLRYLDLSNNKMMKVLPKSIRKLHNLETLILSNCESLIELPNEFCKLAKLRCLEIEGCDEITDMPGGMDKLSCLRRLSMFPMDLSNPHRGEVLKGLKGLTEVKGGLEIRIKGCGSARYEKGNSGELEGGYLMNKEHLNQIDIGFDFEAEEVGKGCQEALMEDMRPHHKLKSLGLREYKGGNLPSWARGNNLAASLPNLVEIHLSSCEELKYLGALRKLSQLRSLRLEWLRKLEYIEEENMKRAGIGGRGVEDTLFFPSLKVLELWDLPRLKGWWREEEERVEYEDDDEDKKAIKRRQPQVSPLFPHLSTLKIKGCPVLALILSVPDVEEVVLEYVDEILKLRGAYKEEEGGHWLTCSDNNSSSSSNISRKVETDSVRCLTSLPSITEMIILGDNKVERLEQVKEVWRSCCSSSLLFLEIRNCHQLNSVGKGALEHLIALEKLIIACCDNVTLNDEEKDEVGDGKHITEGHYSYPSSPPFLRTLHALKLDELPKVVNLPKWMQHLTSLHSLSILRCHNLTLTSTPLPQSIRTLELSNLPKVVNLPEWMQHLTSLNFLHIWQCNSLESLPEWMPCLTSLTHLRIYWCSKELKQRCCRSPTGQDWPYIQHIPYFEIR